jgi:glycosyltransferase involved in cell wall biosynthesis
VFRPVEAGQRERLRAELGIAPGELVVVIAGQTVEGIRQGIASQHAIAALNALPLSLGVRILAVGHSSQRIADRLRHPVLALPFQKEPGEMARCFQSADLCLVTSVVEAFGRIAAEAQACATPVVAFDSGGIPEVVREGVGGIVVPRGDDAALTQAMLTLLEDPARRLGLGGQGRAHVAATFDQAQVARQYARLYRAIVGKAPGHG